MLRTAAAFVLPKYSTVQRRLLHARDGGRAANQRLSARAFALQLPQQILSADQMVVENLPGRLQELADQGISHGVSNADALFRARHNVAGAQHGELLRYDRLIDAKRLL